MSLISRKLSGAPIMRDCTTSKRLSIQTMCFGVIHVLVMRVSGKLDPIYAKYKILGQISSSDSHRNSLRTISPIQHKNHQQVINYPWGGGRRSL